jgi:hypothetical protein
LVGRTEVSLVDYLRETHLELEELYANNRSWSELQDDAGVALKAEGPHERLLRRACGRLLHIDDSERLDAWRNWLSMAAAPDVATLSERDARLLRMLITQLLDSLANREMSLAEGTRLLWEHPQVRAELVELIGALQLRINHLTPELALLPNVPLRLHARYTRLEILSACGIGEGAKTPEWREGVRYAQNLPADIFAFTLDKTSGQFSPTTRYRDYAISRDLIHWESQSTTREDSDTGTRYQRHESLGHHILLFARLSSADRAFYFLGPATYVSHVGELPMAVTWRLHQSLPGDLFQSFAAAVA